MNHALQNSDWKFSKPEHCTSGTLKAEGLEELSPSFNSHKMTSRVRNKNYKRSNVTLKATSMEGMMALTDDHQMLYLLCHLTSLLCVRTANS